MISDNRMLELSEYLKEEGVIKFDSEFCKGIGLLKQNLIRIKKGTAHFTPEHIANACINYGIDANWILGVTDVFNVKTADKIS